ncbi:hypothetical protein [Methylophilus sp. Leaf408]|uniref:hypothetical protein n=1 Tax=Methylophilus sp. Leaf408 TaxID=2876561 RepID=UPI001E55ED2D|nr:hypothetical protein [Methylophilus sp. Leaf408]
MIIILSPAAPVSVISEVLLEDWAIQEIVSQEGVTYHFIGFINERGRISTPISALDTELKEGHTISGRLYKLVGPPGDMAQFELDALCKASLYRYKGISIKDVTLDFMGKRH